MAASRTIAAAPTTKSQYVRPSPSPSRKPRRTASADRVMTTATYVISTAEYSAVGSWSPYTTMKLDVGSGASISRNSTTRATRTTTMPTSRLGRRSRADRAAASTDCASANRPHTIRHRPSRSAMFGSWVSPPRNVTTSGWLMLSPTATKAQHTMSQLTLADWVRTSQSRTTRTARMSQTGIDPQTCRVTGRSRAAPRRGRAARSAGRAGRRRAPPPVRAGCRGSG